MGTQSLRHQLFLMAVTTVFAGLLATMSTACHQTPMTLRTAAVDQNGEPVPYFPRIEAENLNKEPIILPDDLRGRPALVLVAFKRRQQTNVNTWLGMIPDIELAVPGVRVIETPTISGLKWGWMSGFIDGGMRSGIPDLAARDRTITLYTDVGAFRRALGLGSTDEIYAVLLDAEGEVVGIEKGDYEPSKLERLLDASAGDGLLD